MLEGTIILIFYWMIGIWLVGGFCTLFLNYNPSVANKFTYVSSMIGSLLGIIVAILSFTYNAPITLFSWTIAQNIEFTFSLDYLSAFFLLIISGIAFIISIYAPSY